MKFYGQFIPKVDEFIFYRYFPETEIEGVCVECGAFDGVTESSCKFFEETMGWKSFNIEPQPWTYEKLCKNRPDSTNINMALSNHTGTGIFKAVIHPVHGESFGNGSLSHASQHLESLNKEGCSYKDVEVKLMTWPDFVSTNNIKVVDLFVLDVEGHELQVIEGMNGADVLPYIMCVEYGHLGLSVVREALGKLGYVYDITNNANAYFIRKDMVPLFAKRNRYSMSNALYVDGGDNNIVSENRALKNEIARLSQHIVDLTALYESVAGKSKFGKLIRKLIK